MTSCKSFSLLLMTPSPRIIMMLSLLSCGSLFMRYRMLRFIFLRFETIELAILCVCLYAYVMYIAEECRPLLQGRHLESLDMSHAAAFDPPSFIDIGFSDIRKSKEFWTYKHKNFSFCAAQGFRSYMEDRMHFMNDPNHNISIFGIFDGHGGEFVSEYLETNFARAVRERLLRCYSGSGSIRKRSRLASIVWRHSEESLLSSDDDPISEALVTEVHNIDDAISRLDSSQTSLTGSTLIAAIVEQSRYLTVISVGDSRAVAADFHGRPFPLSDDHKPNDAAETRRIESAGGFVHFDGYVHRVQGILAVSRSFGDTQLKREGVLTAHPDVRRVDLVEQPLKFLIVGTDGFWDVVSNDEAVNFASDYLKTHGGPESPGRPDWHRVSTHLVRIALARRSTDNVSVLFIRLWN